MLKARSSKASEHDPRASEGKPVRAIIIGRNATVTRGEEHRVSSGRCAL